MWDIRGESPAGGPIHDLLLLRHGSLNLLIRHRDLVQSLRQLPVLARSLSKEVAEASGILPAASMALISTIWPFSSLRPWLKTLKDPQWPWSCWLSGS